MISHAKLADIDTPSQRWAKDQGACSYGRRSLDRQTLADYYRTTNNADHVIWIARHLRAGVTGLTTDAAFEKQRRYLGEADRCFFGRWAATQARRYYAQLFAQFHVQFPAECL